MEINGMSSKTINLYGDKDINKMAGYGHDISSQRFDDLDKSALICALKYNKKRFIDIGCGEARVGLTASIITDCAILVDIVDVSDKINKFRSNMNTNIEFINIDARALTPDQVMRVDIAYSQRFIHYLRYEEAKKLLAIVFEGSEKDAFLFISASGIKSELGIGYEGLNVPIEDRYFHLEEGCSRKHNILGNVCLYSEDDLCRLATSVGYKKENVYSSAFGNVKGIFKK